MDRVHLQFQTNVLGVVYTTNAFLPLLRAAAATHTVKVLNISSAMGETHFALNCELGTAAPYSVSKAALNMVVAKYAARFKHENIVFVGLSPGLVNTAVRPRKSKFSLPDKMVHSLHVL